jgi:hypothetical protein
MPPGYPWGNAGSGFCTLPQVSAGYYRIPSNLSNDLFLLSEIMGIVALCYVMLSRDAGFLNRGSWVRVPPGAPIRTCPTRRHGERNVPYRGDAGAKRQSLRGLYRIMHDRKGRGAFVGCCRNYPG